MKRKKRKNQRNILLLVICMLCVLMISSTFMMIAYFSEIIEKEAVNVATSYVKSTTADVVSGLDSYKAKVQAFAMAITSTSYENQEDFCVRLRRLPVTSDRYGDVKFIRYFKDGLEYDSEGNLFELSDESPVVKKAVESRTLSALGVIEDRHFNLSVAAFIVPLDNFEYADTLVVCYPTETVVTHSLEEVRDDYARSRIHAVCSTRGEIVQLLHTSDPENVQQHGNIFDVLRKETNDKSIIDEIQQNVNDGTSGSFAVTVSGHKCIICVSGIRDDVTPCFTVVGYYRAEDVNTSGYFIISAVLGEFIIFFASVLAVTIYTIIHAFRVREKIASINDINELIGCPTRTKFEKVADDIISRNKATSFAVAVIDINHYEYISGQVGAPAMTNILRRLKVIYSKNLGLDETYGYEGSGRFIILLHYRENSDLEERLNNMISLATQYGSNLSVNFQLVMAGGVYNTNRNLTNHAAKMIDMAVEAEKATQYPCDFGVFRTYSELQHSSNIQNDYIEVHMESALANHDFKVFYQPKYNIAEKRIDGCEALVRWYNPEIDEYMQPDTFLPLFEANRFIVKLDHYVFEQVCLYINDSLANGLPLVPISVNASRITAADTDFVKYYTRIKQEHQIADGFLTIEFTESFAYEDYDRLRDTVTSLHNSGIKCSIDDFGSGFSSYKILKELPMDEIKLDRMFLREGFSSDRDLKILSSIIKLGRELHMKVTQEGVENEDQVTLLKNLGCQVIQGYFYSKPLALTDYIGFIQQKRLPTQAPND